MKPVIPSVFDVTEDTSGRYTALLIDEAGDELPASSIVTATLSLFDSTLNDDSMTVYVNSREAQNVLNVNDVTIDEFGNLTWDFAPEDMPKLQTHTPETHKAVWTLTWSGGNKQLIHTVIFRVHANPTVS